MFPEVFRCPECDREFVVREPEQSEIHCPACRHYMGERRFSTVIETEIEELIQRLALERDRLEEDEAIYGAGEHTRELEFYGTEVHKALAVLRSAIGQLQELRARYR